MCRIPTVMVRFQLQKIRRRQSRFGSSGKPEMFPAIFATGGGYQFVLGASRLRREGARFSCVLRLVRVSCVSVLVLVFPSVGFTKMLEISCLLLSVTLGHLSKSLCPVRVSLTLRYFIHWAGRRVAEFGEYCSKNYFTYPR